jgi:ribonuclease E
MLEREPTEEGREHASVSQEPSQENPGEQASVPPPAAPSGPERRRRRSTVREPAPTALHDNAPTVTAGPLFSAPVESPAAESPQAAVSSPPEPEAADRPRRSGWWNRRAVGKS